MATTEENLISCLLASSAIKALVANRINFNHAPESDQIPYIFFQQQGGTDDPALDDAAGVPTRARYALECWGDSPASAIVLKNLVQGRLHKYRGTFGDTTVKGIFAEDASDEYEKRGDGSDEGLHGVALFAEVVL